MKHKGKTNQKGNQILSKSTYAFFVLQFAFYRDREEGSYGEKILRRER